MAAGRGGQAPGRGPHPGRGFRIAVLTGGQRGARLVFGLSGWGWRAWGRPLLAVPAYLAVLNLVLAVFNLLPAAPDGGRVLRSILWRWRGDQHQAAVWSARAGRAFGFLLIAGIVRLVMQGAEGVWWVLLGWFLSGVAGAEEKQARAAARLAKVQVRDVRHHSSVAGTPSPPPSSCRRARTRSDQPVVLTGPAGEVRGLLAPARCGHFRRSHGDHQARLSVLAERRRAAGQPDEPLNALLPRPEGRSGAGSGRRRPVGRHRSRQVVRAASEDAETGAGPRPWTTAHPGGTRAAQVAPAQPPDSSAQRSKAA